MRRRVMRRMPFNHKQFQVDAVVFFRLRRAVPGL
jgi:hypothetical protein